MNDYLTIDIGNTSCSCALFRDASIVKRFRFLTRSLMSASVVAASLRSRVGRRVQVQGGALVSVVPKKTVVVQRAFEQAFAVKPTVATASTIPLKLARYHRKQLGADRLVAAFAAWQRYRKPVVVIDAGTAITIDLVNARGEFAGGVIVPGLNTAAVSLHEMTAKLPRVKPTTVKRVLAQTTREAINAGVVVGTAGLVDRLVEELAAEAHVAPLVIATGGDAALLSSESRTIRHLEPDLVHQGLRLLLVP